MKSLYVAVLAGLMCGAGTHAVAHGRAPSHPGDRVNDWIGALQWPDSDVREGAARALGSAGDDRAVRPLMDALGDRAGRVRAAAAWSLGELGVTAAVGRLTRMAQDDPYTEARAAAVTALGKIGEPAAADGLAAALEDRADPVRVAAAEALPAVSGKTATQSLRGLLADDAWQVRHAATAALGELGVASVTDALVHTLAADDHDYVRAGAAHALGRIGNEDAAGALRTAYTSDSSERVRSEAGRALIRMGLAPEPDHSHLEGQQEPEPLSRPEGSMPELDGPDTIDL